MALDRPDLFRSATTRRFALAPGEWGTTAVAALASTGAYLGAGGPYLARGVVGDLLGFAVLGGVGAVRAGPGQARGGGLPGAADRARRPGRAAVAARAARGGVVGAAACFGLAGYVAVRRRVCD